MEDRRQGEESTRQATEEQNSRLSEQIKNANAAGDGAFERSEEDLLRRNIYEDDQKERNSTPY